MIHYANKVIKAQKIRLPLYKRQIILNIRKHGHTVCGWFICQDGWSRELMHWTLLLAADPGQKESDTEGAGHSGCPAGHTEGTGNQGEDKTTAREEGRWTGKHVIGVTVRTG